MASPNGASPINLKPVPQGEPDFRLPLEPLETDRKPLAVDTIAFGTDPVTGHPIWCRNGVWAYFDYYDSSSLELCKEKGLLKENPAPRNCPPFRGDTEIVRWYSIKTELYIAESELNGWLVPPDLGHVDPIPPEQHQSTLEEVMNKLDNIMAEVDDEHKPILAMIMNDVQEVLDSVALPRYSNAES